MKKIFNKLKTKINWVSVIFFTILLNIVTVIDGNFFNWKMNLGILLLVLCVPFYNRD